MMSSEDSGASWQKMKMPDEANYPDAVVIHPDQPDLLFMSAGRRLAGALVSSSAVRAARFSGAATPARPGSGCSAVCRTVSARCSVA